VSPISTFAPRTVTWPGESLGRAWRVDARSFLQLLGTDAREQFGRALALALLRGGPSPADGIAGLRGTSAPTGLPRADGANPPPRLGGAPSSNVTVRGQDGSAFPVRDTHVSSPSEAAWVVERLRQLGGQGLQVGAQQYAGFYGIDYSQSGDNRIHTIDGINVGLAAELYRTMPREQADAILACDLERIRNSRVGRDD
jgi:hypothetical protein